MSCSLCRQGDRRVGGPRVPHSCTRRSRRTVMVTARRSSVCPPPPPLWIYAIHRGCCRVSHAIYSVPDIRRRTTSSRRGYGGPAGAPGVREVAGGAEAAQALQPAGPGGAGVPQRAPDAPVRDRPAAAAARQGEHPQDQLRLAVHRRPEPRKARLRRGRGRTAGGQPARAHDLRPHRRRPRRDARLARRPGGRTRQGVPAVRDGALAARRPAPRRGGGPADRARPRAGVGGGRAERDARSSSTASCRGSS